MSERSSIQENTEPMAIILRGVLGKISPRSASLVDQVTAVLRQAIVEGRLMPGDKLPSEDKLAAHFQVSNTAIREALGKLVAAGAIRKKRGAAGGSIIVGGDSAQIPKAVLDCYQLGGLTLAEVVEFRRLVEPVALELACERRTEADLEGMTANLAASREALTGGRVDREKQVEFHQLVADACHNRMISAALSAAIKISRDFTSRMPLSPREGKRDLSSNEQFFECVKERKTDSAQSLMREHFKRSRWLRQLKTARSQEAPS